MKKTSNALEILRRRREKDPELQRYYEEEKVNFQIALIVREAREEEGLSQEELAKKIGSTQSVISRLEDADYEGHSISMLRRIADALNRRLDIKLGLIGCIENRPCIHLHSVEIIKKAASFTGWNDDVQFEEERKRA